MTALAKLSSIQTKRALRDPATVFFMLALGPMLVIIMGLIFGSDPGLVSFPAFVVAIVGLVIIPMDTVTQRENGSLRRFRATPLPPLTYIAADVLVRFVTCLLSIAVMFALTILVFGVHPKGNLASVVVATALGVLAFFAVGYALAAISPSQGVAQAVGNVLVFPLVFLSGAAVPLEVMPDGARQIAQFSPLTHLVKLLQGLWASQTWADNWISFTVLLGLLAVATAIATKFFRWE